MVKLLDLHALVSNRVARASIQKAAWVAARTRHAAGGSQAAWGGLRWFELKTVWIYDSNALFFCIHKEI
jgi:hypothetical protein